MKLNEKFIEEVMNNLVRNGCPRGICELDAMELDDNSEECGNPDKQKCQECWKKAAEEWVRRQ